MSITLVCDFCKKPITEVAYRITSTSARDLTPINPPHDLHYDCIVPWRLRDLQFEAFADVVDSIIERNYRENENYITRASGEYIATELWTYLTTGKKDS